MYAIVDIAGKQYKAEKDKYIYTDLLSGNEGDKITFDSILLLGDGSNVVVGSPKVSGASVSATILSHVKDDKVICFKKKRRKGFKKKTGHRQQLTKILINGISK
ncbi:MAG: 50S ribosomal protein L21 [Cytophagales bacterium]|nr:MAG: 50S ribosomal protein L21 [Cytophagales bacterium]